MPKGTKTRTRLEDFERNLASASDVHCAQLAAYIDGEGTIYINRTRPNGAHRSRTHKLSLSIKNNSVLLMAWLKSNFWGSAWPDNRKTVSTLTRRLGWTWRVNERQAEAILRRCLPYFNIKRQQAEIGLAFRALKSSGNPGRQQLSEAELQRRDTLRDKIHELNSPPSGAEVVN